MYGSRTDKNLWREDKKGDKKQESKIKRRESKEDWQNGRVKTVTAKNILLGDFSI